MKGKFLGRFFCLYLIGTLYATTNHGDLVPEEGRFVFLLPDGIQNVYILNFMIKFKNRSGGATCIDINIFLKFMVPIKQNWFKSHFLGVLKHKNFQNRVNVYEIKSMVPKKKFVYECHILGIHEHKKFQKSVNVYEIKF